MTFLSPAPTRRLGSAQAVLQVARRAQAGRGGQQASQRGPEMDGERRSRRGAFAQLKDTGHYLLQTAVN